LEFGGRNRGKPTEFIDVDCYMDSIGEFSTLNLPKAKVTAYQKDYILWEKLTALHQFSTQNSNPNPKRLARHWYDVDCLLRMQFADPLTSEDAMKAVIDMKKNRWASPGVNYEAVLTGDLLLIPLAGRLDGIIKDHEDAVKGGMFFTTPDNFTNMVRRLETIQNEINTHIRTIKSAGSGSLKSKSHLIFDELNALDLRSPPCGNGLALLDKVLATCSINNSSPNAHALFVASRIA
jgi:hypothetical protein